MKHDKTYRLIRIILVIHFSIVFLYNTKNIDWIPKRLSEKLEFTEIYCTPIFEQSWKMFSHPPKSNDYIYFKFKIERNNFDNYETDWCDIHSPLIKNNKSYLFSINQRLLKYLSGCMSSIYTNDNMALTSVSDKNNNMLLPINEVNSIRRKKIMESIGFKALAKYSIITFRNLEISKYISTNDSVYVKMKFVQQEIKSIDNKNNPKSYYFDTDYFKIN